MRSYRISGLPVFDDTGAPVGIVALDAREAKALLHAIKVYVGMCRDDSATPRSTGAAVTGIAKLIDLGRGKKERTANSRMRPVTGGTGIGKG